MAPSKASLPSTSTTREAQAAAPASRKRLASFSFPRQGDVQPQKRLASFSFPRPVAASKASRKGSSPAKPTFKAEPPDEEDDASQVMDETSELMDNVVQYSDMGADDEEPCTSSSMLQTPARSAARPKPDRRRTGREQSVESNEWEPGNAVPACVDSPKRKTFYTITDVTQQRPSERFRTDILAQIRSGETDYMPLPNADGSAPSVIRLTDRWREEWSHGVQVLLNPKNLPSFETRRCDIPHYSRGPFRLPATKYLLSKSAPRYEREETHVVYAPPPLRIYQGDRLDELWLERVNREHADNRLPLLELSTMLNLMNEFEIECFKNIHRIVLTALASPSSTNNSCDGVDEDAPCDVCQIKEDNDDPMIFCDGCNVCLHLTCYGLTSVPEGHWECDMCKAVGFTRHERLKCSLCPNSGGAMKEVESSAKWVHVSCAMWIPEIKFTYTKAGREVVQGLETVHDQRWQLKCSICDLRLGACIQCEYKNCATAFHTTCAQRSGVCDVLHEKNEADESVNFHAFCKRHTLLRKREREGWAAGRLKESCVEQSDDETDERSEVLRGLERGFYLHVKFEDAAKTLDVPQIHASDVYEYWKQKRFENGGRPLIAAPHTEIEVDTEVPILSLESAESDLDGQIMLRASDDVQHQLTPFQLKCWRFQKHVFQTADRGRLGCDMIMKRERKKKDIIETSHEMFRQLVDLDAHQVVPISRRVVESIVDGLQQDMTAEEIAESDRLAEEMVNYKPPVKRERSVGASGGGPAPKRKSSLSEAAAAAALPHAIMRTPHNSPSKENGVVVSRGGAKRARTSTGGGKATSTITMTPPSRAGAGGGGAVTVTPAQKSKRSSRRTVSFALSAPSGSSSPPSLPSGKATPTRRLRPQNPPSDELPVPPPAPPSSPAVARHATPRQQSTVSVPSTPPSPVVITIPDTPNKLRERRDVKYF